MLSVGGDPRAQQCGWLKDKYGVSWQIVPTIMPELYKDENSAKSQRVMEAMLPMKKLDIAELERAYAGLSAYIMQHAAFAERHVQVTVLGARLRARLRTRLMVRASARASALLAFPALLAVQSTSHGTPTRATRQCAQSSASPSLARFSRVEQGLRSAVDIRDVTAEPMSLDERMRFYRVPGISIAVIDSFRVIVACGYGVRSIDSSAIGSSAIGSSGKVTSAQVTPTTLFQAASISKSVAALATLKLVQDGRLTLDTDVNQWLTTWKIPENEFTRSRSVTLRTLLSHGAGTTVSGFAGYAAGESMPSLVQVLDGVAPANSAPIRVDKTPGGAWRYSGGGYTILQQLLIDVTGDSFPGFMHDRILQPLGMMHSAYEQPLLPRDTAEAASGYRADGSMVPGRYHTYPELAAAGLWTTPSDLARFVIAIERAGDGAPHAVLSAPIAQQMLTPQTGDYGLGVALAGAGQTLRFSHTGGNEGFRAYYIGFQATGQGVVVMTNSDAGSDLWPEIVRAIAVEYHWPALQPVEKTEAPADIAQVRAISGRYRLTVGTDTVPLDIAARGNTLMAHLSGWAHDRVLHRSAGWTYFVTEDPTELTFEADAAGHVTGATVRSMGQVLHASRK